MEWICGECGDDQSAGASSYCESCRDKYHENQCESCERVGPDDYGYCPDCDRGDCGDCDTIQDRDDFLAYAKYLQGCIDAGIDGYLTFQEWLDDGRPDGPVKEEKEEEKEEEEEVDADEIERRLDAVQKKKATQEE